MKPTLGILGGSGFYEIKELEAVESIEIETPFGSPTSPVITGLLNGKPVVFISRHGNGHQFLASEINYRANIYAMKTLGVDRLISISAFLSLRSDYEPGHLIIPEQLLDFTSNRPRTFFGEGLVASIDAATPFCSHLSTELYQSAIQTDTQVHLGGTLLTVDGPRTTTNAESNLYRAWGVSMINTTSCPEAFLAREAEMCYAVLGHVVRYDLPHPVQTRSNMTKDLPSILLENHIFVLQTLQTLVASLPEDLECQHHNALVGAIQTPASSIPPETAAKLQPLIKKYISQQ